MGLARHRAIANAEAFWTAENAVFAPDAISGRYKETAAPKSLDMPRGSFRIRNLILVSRSLAISASKENLRWIRPALQERSQASFDRILNAAESLLRDRSFDALTISDVVRRAESSVGAFYTRFSNKDALLDALYQRHQVQAIATMKRYLAPEQWESASVEQIVTQIVRYAVRFHRDHRGLLRALVLRGYQNPDWRYNDPKSRSQLSVARVGALMRARQREINHPDAALAGSLGFLSVLAVLRERILFGDSTASALRITARQLEEELIRLYLAYLGVMRRSPRKNTCKATGRSEAQSKIREKRER